MRAKRERAMILKKNATSSFDTFSLNNKTKTSTHLSRSPHSPQGHRGGQGKGPQDRRRRGKSKKKEKKKHPSPRSSRSLTLLKNKKKNDFHEILFFFFFFSSTANRRQALRRAHRPAQLRQGPPVALRPAPRLLPHRRAAALAAPARERAVPRALPRAAAGRALGLRRRRRE